MTAEDLHALIAAVEAADKAHSPDELALKLRLANHPGLDVPGRVVAMIRAAVCADRAGDAAQARSLADGALEHATLHGHKSSRVEALSELGVQLRYAGEFDRSVSLLREAAELADELQDKRLQARAHANLAGTLRRQGHADTAHDEGQTAARLYRDIGDLGGVNRMLHLQSQIRTDQGLLEDARELLEEVIELDAMTGDVEGRARSLGNLSLLLWRMRIGEKAIERMQQAAELFRQLKRPADVVRAMNSLATYRTELGDFDTALGELRTIIAECRRMDNHAELSRALCTQAVIMAKLESNEEALELVKEAERAGGEHIAPPTRQTTLMLRALLALRAGDATTALAHAAEAEQLARTQENLMGTAEALRLKAEALRAAGDLSAAREATLESIEFLDDASAGRTREYLKCVTLAARIERDRGNNEEAGFLAAEGESLRAELQVDDTTRDPELHRTLSDLRELLA